MVWSRMEALLKCCTKMIRNWMLLSDREEVQELESWVKDLEERCAKPPRLVWSGHPSSGDAAIDIDPDSINVPRVADTSVLRSSVLWHGECV
jgi:hypothetical protein